MLPAHAGMVPAADRHVSIHVGAPRARGDGPASRACRAYSHACSPRTRGWSPQLARELHQPPVLPAHAGMVPVIRPCTCCACCAPRARGDGPIKKHAKPGAIVFFDWGGTDEIPKIDHVGIIEKVLDDGRVQTIEGNTDDACKRRVRSASVIAGFWNPPYEEDDMPLTDADVKKIVAAVYDRLTHEVPPDVWAAREGILTPGQKIDPRTAWRQTWAYGKDGYHRLREILAKLDAQNAAIKALADALAARDAAINADELVERIRAEIASVTVRLVTDDPA